MIGEGEEERGVRQGGFLPFSGEVGDYLRDDGNAPRIEIVVKKKGGCHRPARRKGGTILGGIRSHRP